MNGPPPRRDREAIRSAGVVILLIASLLLAVVLAWQAADAARSHRAATAAVLRDFAALSGAEFVRRSSAAIGFDANQVLTALRQETPIETPGTVPDRGRMARALEPRSGTAFPLLGERFFRYEPDTGALTFSEPVAAPLAGFLRKSLEDQASRLADGRPFTAFHTVLDGEFHIFLSAPLAPEVRGSARVVGFEITLSALPSRFEQILGRAPLLPSAIGRGKVGNEHLSIVVRDGAGRDRFRAGSFPPSAFAAEVAFKDASTGILDGMTASLSLDEAAAPGLVIGGLPRSRLPLQILLLVLSIGFVAAGIRQLRRERQVAALRSEFVSRVSHELRTPLTQIRMFSETLLLERTRSDTERRRALEIIHRETGRLAQLVDNALQFTRGERGTLALDPRTRDLQPLILDTLEGFEPLVLRAGTRIESRLSGPLLARVDGDALRQILLNLLDNAAKYGPEGQTILVGAGSHNGSIRLWVEDQGSGVPPGERERIWRPFQRLSRDEGAVVAGTGIGLSVVRDLTLLHQGRCWVESGDRGGARFVVEFASLPAAADGDAGDARA